MVAGQLIEDVTGETWEKFVADHVLKPAGMLHSTTDNEVPLRDPGPRATARAHEWRLARHGRSGRRSMSATTLGATRRRPAVLAISANDMARWLMIQLDGGKLPDNGGRLFSEAAHDQMWTPVVLQPVRPRTGVLKPTQPMFNTYALGWDVRDYRGAKIVWHGGAVFGFLTAVVLIPEKHVGFSIEINSEDGEIIIGLMYELLDHYLGLAER